MNDHERLVGRRVIHDGTGKEGVIAYEPRMTATSVWVLFDGASEPVPCHPDQIDFIPMEKRYA